MVKEIKSKYKGAPIRLWVKGRFVSFRRSQRKQYENQALVQIEGVNDKKATGYYHGKKVVYVYKAKTIKKNTKFRTIWGRVARHHGNNGIVKVRFYKNLPPQAIGSRVRVMLYPQKDECL